MKSANLLLHYYPKAVPKSEIEKIADLIRSRAPDIKVKVLSTDRPHPSCMVSALGRQTISVEFNRVKFFPLVRGRRFQQWHKSSKSRQYRALEAQDIPIPKWTKIQPETKLDVAEWGSHVIEKPNRGSKGAYVRIKRTSKVRFRDTGELEADNPGRTDGMLVQKLVCTGDWPVSYRVTTLFGAPLIALRYEGVRGRLYETASNGSRKLVGPAAVASAKGSKISACNDEEILRLARLTHHALPDVPILGIDIIRDVIEDRLWVLEVNPDGFTWPLGSRPALEVMASTGIDLYRQFDGLETAAETLVNLCRNNIQSAVDLQPAH
ncbi:MAG: hypothetical protein AAF414_02390 [Pseudomonadota bacterium]